MKVKEINYTHWSWKREMQHTIWGPSGRNIRESKRNGDPWTSAVVGVRVEHESKMHEGVLLVYLSVSRTQGRAGKGTCGKVKPYHFAVPGYLGRGWGVAPSLLVGMLRHHVI